LKPGVIHGEEEAAKVVYEGVQGGSGSAVQVGDRSIGKVARDLDLTETALRAWVKQAEVDAGHGPPEALTTAEREELARLRREIKRLQMERDILKAAAAAHSSRQGNRRRKLSAGDRKPRVLRGRSFNWRTTSFRSRCV
jgi:transposase